MKHWAILGCGYVGKRLARGLIADGHRVAITSRTEEGRSALAAAVPGAEARVYQMGEALDEAYDVVVISAPPSPDGPDPEAAVAEMLTEATRLVYLSTTGVYAAADGNEVADDYELAPGSARGARRLAVEGALQERQENLALLRIPGIYGPGRGVHARLASGTYRLIGESESLVSRIYVDDLTSAIRLLGETETLAHVAYVVGDELPTSASEHGRGVAELLGLAAPPVVDPQTVRPEVRAMLGANRRVVPRRLHALGWRAQKPTWREGLQAALAEEAEAAS